jgi:hypothetical protein
VDHISARRDVNDDYPRPLGDTLTRSELEPGDILLSRGDSKISDQIVVADRASYSHCALWSGRGIIEATLKGGIEEHERPSGERDVYRYRSLSQLDAERVVQNARNQVAGAYAVAEIHLLAIVFQKWWPFGRPRRSAADALLDIFGTRGDALRDWLQTAYAQKTPRVCSELVALAYFEANCPIRVRPLGERPPRPLAAAAPAPAAQSTRAAAVPLADPKADVPNAPSLGSDELEVLHDQTRQVLQDASAGAAGAAEEGLFWGGVALDTNTNEVIGVVTPGDLQFSPSLEFRGTLRA